MGDEPKSAWELALEKLKQQDRERGESGPAALSADQKKAIADIRARFQAKVAEIEILHRSNQMKAAGDAEALAKVEEEYQHDRRRLEEQRDVAIEKARAGNGRRKKTT
jgi:hypothetical protein